MRELIPSITHLLPHFRWEFILFICPCGNIGWDLSPYSKVRNAVWAKAWAMYL